MLFIFGKRTIRIAHFVDTDSICYPCKAYEREIAVYRSYFHLCLIPVFPVGGNLFEIRCKNCGNATKSEILVKKYERQVKTPIWLFSALFLTALIAGIWFYWNQTMQTHYREYLAKPRVGDMYMMKEVDPAGSSYYFLRITSTIGDSVAALHNNLDYGDFVNQLAADDYFVKDDTVYYPKKELQKMLENGQIYSVKRETGNDPDHTK